jgi:diguanylate cyclase (GGDEF)-like protein
MVSGVIMPIPDDWGAPCALTAFITDISERKHAEARLRELATHDSLTGLPNRAWINQRLDAMLAQPLRDLYTTVFFIDLNRFKAVNDSMGAFHRRPPVAARGTAAHSCMRPGDAVARLDGDEFMVAASCAGRDAASAIAERLLAALQLPFIVDGIELCVGAAIGISLAAGNGSTGQLFQHADSAMYQAKSLGADGFRFFEQETNCST